MAEGNTNTNTNPESSNQADFSATELFTQEIDQVTRIYNIIVDFFANYTFQLIGALIIMSLGYFLAGKLSRVVLGVCERHHLDVTLSRFISNATRMLVVILVGIIALGKLGLSVTPIVAAIGAVSLGAGLAMQGLLSNYAAGFNIIFIRPFVVGDTISVRGVTGVVKEVLLAYTILTDEDEVEIMIPNKHIVGEVLHNSKQDSLLELTVGIDYQHNPNDVVDMIVKTLTKLPCVSQGKEPLVGIEEFADSSINIGIRFWTPTVGLYSAKFEAYRAIYNLLEQENIKIPFPQRDVRLIQDAS